MYNIIKATIKSKWTLSLLSLMLVLQASAQSRVIKGNIVDDADEPVIGATVLVVGSHEGTTSDYEGNFSVNIGSATALEFSYIGYETQIIEVGDQSHLEIKLKTLNNQLDEVVVVGYGSTRRQDLTGSISSLSSDKIEGHISSTVLDAMSGKVAGVQIVASDGTPGSGLNIRVRGVGTVNGDASPLYIVDGFQVDNINHLSNNDIKSIDILKDASSSAIYGSRAANGVVLVTTKSGAKGALKISYNGSASYRSISKYLDMMNPYEFVKLQVEMAPTEFGETYFKGGNDSDGNPYLYQKLGDYASVKGIDWQKETFKPTWSNNHNLSLSGGSDKSTYLFSFDRYDEEGIFINSGYTKTAAKMRISQQMNKRIKLDATISYNSSLKQGSGTAGNTGSFNMLGRILKARPTGGLRYSDEDLLTAVIDPLILAEGGSISQGNPIIQAEAITKEQNTEQWIANGGLTIDLGRGFSFKTTGTYNVNNRRNYTFYPADSMEAFRTGTISGQNNMSRLVRWSNSNVLSYKMKKRSGHSFDAMVGHEIDFSGSEYLTAGASDFPFDDLGNLNLGLGATPTIADSGYSNQYLVSFFTRANYNYDDRLYLTATMRADGSSKFAAANKWGYFPSVSAAWRISGEEFLKHNDVVSNLKLRAGWGTVGNDRIPSLLDLHLFSGVNYGWGSSVVSGLVPTQIPNENLKWEGSSTINVGVDIGLFDNRLNITADAFVKDTKDMLMKQSLPYVSGFEYQWQNIGKIRNQGVELAINSVNITSSSGFVWTTDFNVSFLDNKLLELQNGEKEMYASSGWNSNYSGYDYIARVNEPIGNMYGYIFDGVYQSSDFVYNAATGKTQLKEGITDISQHAGLIDGVRPGFIKYKDLNGDGVITTADRGIIGNGLPTLYGGMTNSFSYKGFDFSFMLQFSYGNDIFNAVKAYGSESQTQRANMLGYIADRWTPTNASNSVPAWDGYVKDEINSRFVEDGSYLRLTNLTLGYTLPAQLTRKFYVSKMRFYVAAQNLYTLTSYSGYDPEVNMAASNPLTPGLDWGAYPKSRVFTIGANITL